MKITILLSITITIVTFLFPAALYASHGGPLPHLVPACNTATVCKDAATGETQEIGNVCTICDLFALIKNILDFAYIIATGLAALFLVWGGLLMILPYLGGPMEMHTRGKSIVTKALVGVLIVFFAWLGIDTVIKLIASQSIGSGEPAEIPKSVDVVGGGAIDFGPWNEIDCAATTISVPCPEIPVGPVGEDGTDFTGDPSADALVENNLDDFAASGDCVGFDGPVGPQTNIVEAADGKPITTCQAGCSTTTNIMCSPNASVSLNQTMLAQINILLSDVNFKDQVQIESLATGDHSATSLHYTGDAVDITLVPGATVSYQDLKDFMGSLGGGTAICDAGGQTVPCSDATHVHVGY